MGETKERLRLLGVEEKNMAPRLVFGMFMMVKTNLFNVPEFRFGRVIEVDK